MLSAYYKQQELSAKLEVVNREWAVYSEEETVIGEYDGKPLYRKKIETTSPAAANQTTVIAGYPDGVEPTTVVSLNGFLFQTDVNIQPINLYAVDNYIFTVPFGGGISMYVTAPFRSKKVVLTLEYTKTTDPEGAIEVLPANYVHSYDTEDGWHVRKYSDGYVEMTKKVVLTNVNLKPITGWVGTFNAPFIGPYSYPLTLTELFWCNVYSVGFGRGGTVGDTSPVDIDVLHFTPKITIWTPVSEAGSVSGTVFYHACGRWK